MKAVRYEVILNKALNDVNVSDTMQAEFLCEHFFSF